MLAALIDKNSVVENIIVWEENAWVPPGLQEVVITGNTTVSIGYTYSNGTFTPPVTPPVPATKPMLLAFASSLQNDLINIGITVNVGTTQNPINIECDGNSSTIATLNSFNIWGTANPTATRTWWNNNWVGTELTGAQCVKLANAITQWVNDLYNANGAINAEIASGQITTYDQIDSYPWPTN